MNSRESDGDFQVVAVNPSTLPRVEFGSIGCTGLKDRKVATCGPGGYDLRDWISVIFETPLWGLPTSYCNPSDLWQKLHEEIWLLKMMGFLQLASCLLRSIANYDS